MRGLAHHELAEELGLELRGGGEPRLPKRVSTSSMRPAAGVVTARLLRGLGARAAEQHGAAERVLLEQHARRGFANARDQRAAMTHPRAALRERAPHLGTRDEAQREPARRFERGGRRDHLVDEAEREGLARPHVAARETEIDRGLRPAR